MAIRPTMQTASIAFGLPSIAARNVPLASRGVVSVSGTSTALDCSIGKVGLGKRSASERYARVEPHVEKIDEQVGHHEDQRADDDHGLHHGIVPSRDRLHGEQTHARPREHRLDDDRTTEQMAKLEAN